MTPLVRAELIKLRTVQTTAWLFLVTLSVVILEVLAFVLGAEEGTGRGQRDDPHLLAFALASAGAGQVIVMVLGILALSHEFRFGTVSSTFLVTPKRGYVVAAKLAAISIVGAGFALVSMAVVIPLSVALIRTRDGTVQWDARAAEVLVAVIAVMILYGPIGIAIAALVRNQIAAIAGALTWLFIIEGVLAAMLPDLARWTPGGATGAALQIGNWLGTDNMLNPWLAGLVLIGWTTLLATIGSRSALRRDLT
jgi:ABC-2 type transport system permease protein